MTKTVNLKFGKKAEDTYWGLRGCSHGMYNTYSFDFYVYGIKNIFNLTIKKEW